MKKDYLLPGAIALALLAIPLIGFRHSAAPVFKVTAPKPVTLAAPPLDQEMSVASDSGEAGPGHPVDTPSLPDTTPVRREPVAFEVPTVPTPIPAAPNPLKVPSHWTYPGPGGPGDHRSIIPAAVLDNAPKVLAQIAPHYPQSALHNGMGGEVQVAFWVDENGRVHDPRVISATATEFEEPTLRAVAKWRFEPGRKDGQVTSFEMAVPVVFSVRD